MTIYSKNESEFTLESELRRKTIETLEAVVREHESGAITSEMYQAKLYAIDDVTRGLVDEEINLAIDQAVREITHVAQTQALVNLENEDVVILCRELGTTQFFVWQIKGGRMIRKEYKSEEGDNPVLLSHQKYTRSISALNEKGFVNLEGLL